MFKQALVLTMKQLATSPFAPSGYVPAVPFTPQTSSSAQLYTKEQVQQIVRDAVRVREEELRAEFTEMLNEQLRDQFNVFSTFNRDYVSRSMARSENDYFS